MYDYLFAIIIFVTLFLLVIYIKNMLLYYLNFDACLHLSKIKSTYAGYTPPPSPNILELYYRSLTTVSNSPRMRKKMYIYTEEFLFQR